MIPGYHNISYLNGSYRIFIPPEIVITEYHSKRDRSSITKSNGGYLSARAGSRTLYKITGLTPVEYFHKVILGSNIIPTCDECGKQLKFQSIIYGYGSRHPWITKNHHYCSNNCRLKGRFDDFGPADDIVQFYIASVEGKFKYGVSKDIQSRATWTPKYSNFKILITSKRSLISKLEYLIKSDLGGREYLDWSEVKYFRKAYLKFIKIIV